jgi:acetyltransferase-like isoleucine patch superfamily enzyme
MKRGNGVSWGEISRWSYVRPWVVRFKRLLLFERPQGLRLLGRDSVVRRPRTLWGRSHIKIGARCLVMPNSLMQAVTDYAGEFYSPSICIGDDVYIGRNVYLVSAQGITISSGCVLSEHVYITDLNHGYNPHAGLIMKQAIESKGPVRIGPNCFLGYRSVVTPGVTLGAWCIVGANSVVTRSFPPYSMIAGAPARLIKVYSHELRQWVRPTKAVE